MLFETNIEPKLDVDEMAESVEPETEIIFLMLMHKKIQMIVLQIRPRPSKTERVTTLSLSKTKVMQIMPTYLNYTWAHVLEK